MRRKDEGVLSYLKMGIYMRLPELYLQKPGLRRPRASLRTDPKEAIIERAPLLVTPEWIRARTEI